MTAFSTSNPVGSTSSNLQEGPDATTTVVPEFECVSSAALQEEFWAWRDAHPDSPYSAHIQTTDVHEPFRSQPPFAGLYLDEVAREEYFRWDEEIEDFGGWTSSRPIRRSAQRRIATPQPNRRSTTNAWCIRTLQIGRLVENLKARGEWQNTLLVVTADHGYPAGSHRLMEPMAQWRSLLPHLRYPHPDAGCLAWEDSRRCASVGAGVADRSVADPTRTRQPAASNPGAGSFACRGAPCRCRARAKPVFHRHAGYGLRHRGDDWNSGDRRWPMGCFVGHQLETLR